MANSRYGLDLGNILAQASNIKSARLDIQQKERKLDKQAAGDKLRANVFSEDGLPQEEVNRLSVLAPAVAKDIQATQQKTAQVESLTNYYMKRGLPKEEASLKATGYAKDIDTFDKEYRTKTKFEQEQIRISISQQGQAVQSMMEVAKDNPQQAESMYQDYIKSKNDQIKKLLREGQTEIADKIQESIDKAPSTLIKSDGTFDAEFPMMSLSKMSTMMANAETWDAQAKSDIKIAEAEEKAKIKKVEKAGSSDFERVLASMDLTKEEEKAYKSAWLTKKTQPDRTSLLINMQTVQKAQSDFASSLNLDSPYRLSTIDTRKWSPEQQAEGNQVASVIIKGLGANAKLVEKKMGEYGAASDQMRNALNAYEQVGDFRAVDEMTKKYFSNYFGLSEKELQSTEAAQAFQSMLNIKIKADSGSAVSGQEMVRNTLETASPYMTKAKIKSGIKNVAKRYIGELTSLKRVMGPVAFNLKYGAVLSNYEDIAKAVDTAKVTKADDLARLRASKPKQNRQSVYNQISTQRPNATPQQINAYLDSKGY